MIFYTLKGPVYDLEIHEDKICMTRKGIWNIFGTKVTECNWSLEDLAQFQVQPAKFLRLGKIQWSSFEGKKQSIRFTTNAQMVSKIERYMQKVIIKNFQKKRPESYHDTEQSQAMAA